MEPLLKDSPNKGHHINYLSTKDTFKHRLSYSANTFPPLNSGQPLYSGQISWSQCVLYKEVPMYFKAVYGYWRMRTVSFLNIIPSLLHCTSSLNCEVRLCYEDINDSSVQSFVISRIRYWIILFHLGNN